MPPTGAERVHTLHTDHLHTPRLATDAAGAVIWRLQNGRAFGDTAPSGSVTINLRFPGQYYDAESGLHYNWNRYYDPKVGRYITSDPIGLGGGVNTYAYVGGNPVNYSDPLGLCPCGTADDLISLARSDTRDWSKIADRTDVNSGFSSGTYKCNLFADTQYEGSGYNLPNIGGSWLSQLFDKYPPGAQSLSDQNYAVPGWPVVSGPAQKGDLIADQGHVGIVSGTSQTISASPSGVVENNWGFRQGQSPVVRRCACP